MAQAEGSGSTDPSSLIRPPLRFSGIVASTGRLYAARLKQLLAVFAVIAALIFMVPALIFFDVGDNLAIAIYLLAGVVFPTALLSLGVAVSTDNLETYLGGEEKSARASLRALRARAKDVLVAALLSGMLALTIVVFFGPFGSLVIGLFYGPPILMQVIVAEGRNVQDAWARTRTMMQGHWARILMAIFTIALGLSILQTTLLTLGGGLVDDAPRAAQLAVFVVLQLVIFGFGYSYLAAAGYVCYYDVKERFEEESAE